MRQKIKSFYQGLSGQSRTESRSTLIRKDKRMRERQSEKELDKTLNDSFPASDPPGNY